MLDLKTKLKKIIGNLDPKILGLKNIEINSVKRLGTGEGHLNYLALICRKKFLLRVGFDMPENTKHEYRCLKAIEKLHITPKAYYLHKPNKEFNHTFSILEFIEGKPLRKRKKNYPKEEIESLARLLKKIHSKKPKIRLGKDYAKALKQAEKEYIKKIKSYSGKKIEPLLQAMQKEVKKMLSQKREHPRRLVHGDLCPQNTVKTKKGLKLIDWENVSLTDPAVDIAHLTADMKFTDKDFEMFFKEYGRNKQLFERAKTYAKALHYEYFLWEIVRTFEILNKELPEQYLKSTSAKTHLLEAKRQFRKCIKAGIVATEHREFNVEQIKS